MSKLDFFLLYYFTQ